MTITYIPAKRTVERQCKPSRFHIKLTKKKLEAIKKTSIFITSNLFSITPILSATAVSTFSTVDVGGQKLFEMFIHLGYWVAVIGCSIAIIRKVKDGDVGTILGTVLKFVVLYASLFGIRIFLDVVNESFGLAAGMSLPNSGFNAFVGSSSKVVDDAAQRAIEDAAEKAAEKAAAKAAAKVLEGSTNFSPFLPF